MGKYKKEKPNKKTKKTHRKKIENGWNKKKYEGSERKYKK